MQEKYCPECKKILSKVSVNVLYGMSIVVDQCDACGGLWFDRDELFRASVADTDLKQSLNKDIFCKKTITHSVDLICPNDGNILIAFRDENFPSDLQVESCVKCDGFWMNHGEYIHYDNYRDEKSKVKNHAKEDNFSRDIEKLLRSQENSNGYDSLGRLASFLSTPIEYSPLHGFRAVNSYEKANHPIVPMTKDISSGRQLLDDLQIQSLIHDVNEKYAGRGGNVYITNKSIRFIQQVLRAVLGIFIGRLP